jgi:hypothetical protein
MNVITARDTGSKCIAEAAAGKCNHMKAFDYVHKSSTQEFS